MDQKYKIILYWSEDDQAFVAEVPELPGCMAHGDSQESALASVNDAITFWVATAEELGRAVPTRGAGALPMPDSDHVVVPC